MLDFRQSLIRSMLHKVLKRLHYPLEVMLTWVRWYVSCPLSLRHIDAGTRCICRPHHSASLGHQGAAGSGRCFSNAQATSWPQLEA
jgi:hypothetical protein